jgi:hypothetical protein
MQPYFMLIEQATIGMLVNGKQRSRRRKTIHCRVAQAIELNKRDIKLNGCDKGDPPGAKSR